MSHITGGGIEGNTQRVLPGGLRLQIQWGNWHVPPIFKLIQHWGSVPDDEMRRIFNLGIGLILIVGKENRDQLIALMKKRGEDPVIVGHVI
jgi:phosphoribosylformylglycinamidine cyclo-ligase